MYNRVDCTYLFIRNKSHILDFQRLSDMKKIIIKYATLHSYLIYISMI